MRPAEQFQVSQVLPSYWRVSFDNGPINLLDPDTIEQLGALIERMEQYPDLTVVVFRSETVSKPTSAPRSGSCGDKTRKPATSLGP